MGILDKIKDDILKRGGRAVGKEAEEVIGDIYRDRDDRRRDQERDARNQRNEERDATRQADNRFKAEKREIEDKHDDIDDALDDVKKDARDTYNTALREVKDTQNQLGRDLKSGLISTDEYNAQIASLRQDRTDAREAYDEIKEEVNEAKAENREDEARAIEDLRDRYYPEQATAPGQRVSYNGADPLLDDPMGEVTGEHRGEFVQVASAEYDVEALIPALGNESAFEQQAGLRGITVAELRDLGGPAGSEGLEQGGQDQVMTMTV